VTIPVPQSWDAVESDPQGEQRLNSVDNSAEPEPEGGLLLELRQQLQQKEQEVLELRKRIMDAGVSTPKALSDANSRPLSIVIPMGGSNDGFEKAGFRYPRPLVNIVGRPLLLWLLDHLSVRVQDSVFIMVPSVMEKQHGISKMVASHFPHHNVRVISLPFATRGWAETVFASVQQMNTKELRQPLVTLDSSNIYHSVDILERVRKLPSGLGASVYFDTEGSAKLHAMGSVAVQFSYLQLDERSRITQIREKAVISAHANTGAYIFASARDFRVAVESILDKPEEAAKGGLYASAVLSSMLMQRVEFQGLRIESDEFAALSTPPQLDAFVQRVSSGLVPMARAMRFCFDLDGTLVTQPRAANDLATCEPIQKAISLVRQLYEAGHIIIITTSRGMVGESVGAAIAKVGNVTFSTLTELGIPYHELHFGKPHADVYIDSRSLNAQGDVERDLGWNISGVGNKTPHDLLEGAVDARAFNMVRAAGKENVMKCSKSEILRGECFWYRSIPPELASLFPRLLEISEGVEDAHGEAFSTITMSKVPGVTFAHLATARVLMAQWVRRLVRALHSIHCHKPSLMSAAANEPRATNSELCSNYAKKVAKRFKKHKLFYETLGEEIGLDTNAVAMSILGFLEEYEAGERAMHAHYIHGDPVFSNVMRTDEDTVVLVDMRGELGSRLTTQGDVLYDLSKVYQSLSGYDFMLLDQPSDETTSEALDKLRAAFWDEVRSLYPDVSHRDVRLHTAAHFFTIVPLHEVRSRMVRFLRASHSMLLVEGLL